MWQWLNPLNWIKILSLVLTIIDGVKAIYQKIKESNAQRAAEKASKEAQEAVDEIRMPIDQSKTKEEKDAEAEAAADRFHDRLK